MKRCLPSHPSSLAIACINHWLSHFDAFPLECDGMTRSLSTALTREGIEHQVISGYLHDKQTGNFINHFWISLSDDYLIDLRARMWMGEKAPHGCFLNGNAVIDYQRSNEVKDFTLDPTLFHILTGTSLDDIPAFPSQAFEPVPSVPSKESFWLDKSGNPLRVFRGEHGRLDGNITALQTALGSYVFSTCAVANAYATVANDHSLWSEDAQPRIIPCYLKMSNPVFNSNLDPYVDFDDLVKLMGSVSATQLALRIAPDIEDTNAFYELAEELGIESLQELINTAPQELSKLYAHIWRILDDAQFIAWCKDNGYDGAISLGSGESMDALEYRVFDQEQVEYALSPESKEPAQQMSCRPKQPVAEPEPF